MKKQTKGKSKAATKKARTYLREVEIRYKKRRVKDSSPAGKSVDGPEKIAELFHELQRASKEKLITISLDAKTKIICFEVISIGSVDSVYARPAEVVRASIMVNAYSVIVVHNHVSGDPSPSPADEKFTKDLKLVIDALGMKFFDHVVIGDDRFFSFAQQGLLGSTRTSSRP